MGRPRPVAFRKLRRVLIWFWAVNVIFCEVFFPWIFGFFVYHWPSGSHDTDYDTHVLVISDPQITDAYSYGHDGFVLWLEEFYCDLYMRRQNRAIMSHLNPQPTAVVFLGDLFDGGRTLDFTSTEFDKHVSRFQSIFQLPASVSDNREPLYLFLSGNHDVGQGKWYRPEAGRVFEQVYSPTLGLDFEIRLGGVDIIGVNSQALSKRTQRINRFEYSVDLGLVASGTDKSATFETSDNPSSEHGTQPHRIGWAGRSIQYDFYQSSDNKYEFDAADVQQCGATSYLFVQNQLEKHQLEHSMRDPESRRPRILLTHVPLFRKRSSERQCGPNRPFSKKDISNSYGTSYQNLLAEDLSQLLLRATRPSLVLSGDDHAACHVTHTWTDLIQDTNQNVLRQPVEDDHATEPQVTVEETIPTFSWLMGERYPGFAVLSLPSEEVVASDLQRGRRPPPPLVSILFLPVQLYIYLWYALAGVVTLLVVPLVVGVHEILTRTSHCEDKVTGPGPVGTCLSTSDDKAGAHKRPADSLPVAIQKLVFHVLWVDLSAVGVAVLAYSASLLYEWFYM